MIGIYKITSPENKIYVGQSVNIKSRKDSYSYGHGVSGQPILFSSIWKYGWDSHSFEVIEKCDKKELNKRERYWQEYYDCIGDIGLNCFLTRCEGKKQVYSKKRRKVRLETIQRSRFTRLLNSLTDELVIIDILKNEKNSSAWEWLNKNQSNRKQKVRRRLHFTRMNKGQQMNKRIDERVREEVIVCNKKINELINIINKHDLITKHQTKFNKLCEKYNSLKEYISNVINDTSPIDLTKYKWGEM